MVHYISFTERKYVLEYTAVQNIYKVVTVFSGKEEHMKVEMSKEEAAVITNHITHAY
jgi:hypothetical protein